MAPLYKKKEFSIDISLIFIILTLLKIINRFSVFKFHSFYISEKFSSLSLYFSLSPLVYVRGFVVTEQDPLMFNSIGFLPTVALMSFHLDGDFDSTIPSMTDSCCLLASTISGRSTILISEGTADLECVTSHACRKQKAKGGLCAIRKKNPN